MDPFDGEATTYTLEKTPGPGGAWLVSFYNVDDQGAIGAYTSEAHAKRVIREYAGVNRLPRCIDDRFYVISDGDD